jgi:hypothetical protein
VEAFFSAVDFREPLLQTVIVAHLVFAAMAVLTRKNTNMQIGMLGVACEEAQTRIISHGTQCQRAADASQLYSRLPLLLPSPDPLFLRLSLLFCLFRSARRALRLLYQ